MPEEAARPFFTLHDPSDPPTPARVLGERAATAYKPLLCQTCQRTILPGERFTSRISSIENDPDGRVTEIRHEDGALCERMAAEPW